MELSTGIGERLQLRITTIELHEAARAGTHNALKGEQETFAASARGTSHKIGSGHFKRKNV